MDLALSTLKHLFANKDNNYVEAVRSFGADTPKDVNSWESPFSKCHVKYSREISQAKSLLINSGISVTPHTSVKMKQYGVEVFISPPIS